MGIKSGIERKIEELTYSFWHNAKYTWTHPLLPQYYDEIQQLKQDLEMVVGIEKAAFMYAMINVNGSTELISEAAFKVYLSKEI
jgi:hypothetical protein